MCVLVFKRLKLLSNHQKRASLRNPEAYKGQYCGRGPVEIPFSMTWPVRFNFKG